MGMVRTIDAVLQNGSSFLLEFNGDKSKCVALNNSGSGVVIKAATVAVASSGSSRETSGLTSWQAQRGHLS